MLMFPARPLLGRAGASTLGTMGLPLSNGWQAGAELDRQLLRPDPEADRRLIILLAAVALRVPKARASQRYASARRNGSSNRGYP